MTKLGNKAENLTDKEEAAAAEYIQTENYNSLKGETKENRFI